MADDRDHRKTKTPPAGVQAQLARPSTERPVDSESWEDPTGNYTGDELARIRAKRPTHERVGRLETKVDKLSETVANIDGKLDVIPQLVSLLEKVVGAEIAGDHATLHATLDIKKANAADQIEAAKERRARWALLWAKLVAGVSIAAAAVLGILQARSC